LNLKMPTPRIIASADIGTSNVTTFIAEAGTGQDGGPRIIAAGVAPVSGIRKGIIVDAQSVRESVHAAFDEMERAAGSRMRNVWLSLSGVGLCVGHCLGATSATGPGGVVSREDAIRATKNAKSVAFCSKEDFPEYVTYAHLRQAFRLDKEAFDNPVGQHGRILEANMWGVAVPAKRLKGLAQLIAGYAELGEMIVSSLASGAVIISPEQKTHGSLLIDLGAGTTEFAFYRGGHIVMTGALPVGGEHITNDIVTALRLGTGSAASAISGREFAEKLKRDFDPVQVAAKPDAFVWRYGDQRVGDRKIPLCSVETVVRLRVSEIFRLVAAAVGEFTQAPAQDIATGIVLTGGGARLRGVAQIAAETTGLDVRFAEFPEWVPEEFAKFEFSVALGLLVHASTKILRQPPPPQTLWQKIKRALFN
jgi:cell division protein FtsA